MKDLEKPNTSTEVPATPSTTDTSTTSMTATTGTIPASAVATPPATLPAGYMSNGSMVDADGVLQQEYVTQYAQQMAERLKPMRATAFHTAFLKEAKEARKKKVPYGIKKNCALGMVTQAKKLAHRKKDPAPSVLVDMITAATATVKDAATFEVLYMHLDAIYSYLLDD